MDPVRSRLWVLVRKEVRELGKERTVLFGLIIGPILLFAIMGGIAGQVAKQAEREAAAPMRIAIVYRDDQPGNITVLLARALNASLYTGVDPQRLIREGYDAVVVVGPGFEENISRGIPGGVTVIYRPSSLSIVGTARAQAVTSAIEAAVHSVVAQMVRSVLPNATARFLEEPVQARILYYFRGELIGERELQAMFMGLSLALPLAILMIGVSATQVAAVSIGIEKENRTLEKLLTLPVDRGTLMTAKILGVGLLALAGVASYGAGLLIYLRQLESSITQGQTGEAMPGVSLPPATIAVTLAGLVAALYSSIAIGFLVGSQADSVRESQLAASYVSFLLSLPLFMLMFGLDPSRLSKAGLALVSLDPYGLLALASTASVYGDLRAAGLALAGMLVHAAFWTRLVAALLDPEQVLTGRLRSRLRRLQARARLSR